MTGEYYIKEDWIESTSITELGEMAFSSSMGEPGQMAEIRRRVQSWLGTKTEELDGNAVLLEGDYNPKTYDSTRSIEYSREETRVVDGQAQVSAVLNRPLNHIRPWVFSRMLD